VALSLALLSRLGADLLARAFRRLGRHLASLLAHSLSLCADPPKSTVEFNPSEDESDASAHLAAIPGSPSTSPVPSRNTSVSAESMSFSMAGSLPSTSPPYEPSMAALPSLTNVVPSAPAFPVLSEAKRFKLINNLQSWTFNAMSYTSDELLSCVGIIFESVRNMEGVQFDLGSSLLSLPPLVRVLSAFETLTLSLVSDRSIQDAPPLPSLRLSRSQRLPQLLARRRRDSSLLLLPRADGSRTSTLPTLRGRLRPQPRRGTPQVEEEPRGRGRRHGRAAPANGRLCAHGRRDWTRRRTPWTE
jgi:hypothetical protein